MKVKILSKQTPYQGFLAIAVYELQHELFAGGWSTPLRRELLVRGKAVAVLLHDPISDQVLLVEQFRIGALHPISTEQEDEADPAWQLEIVAGILEAGESPEDVARREAMEEAGCSVQQLEPIIEYYPSAGGCNERISVFYAAVDLSATSAGFYGLASEHEDIRTQLLPFEDCMALLNSGKIQSSMTIIALQWLALRKATR